MTCIAAWIEKGVVTMGGDSAGVAGYSITTRADEKVFQVGPYLIGFTTSFRMGDVLRYQFDPPEFEGGGDLRGFMVREFIPKVRAVFWDAGWTENEKGREHGGTFLVGAYGKLFEVDSDFQVGVPRDRFSAVGCGQDIAKGAFFAGQAMKALTPEKRVLLALAAAERFSAGVRRPFVVRTLG